MRRNRFHQGKEGRRNHLELKNSIILRPIGDNGKWSTTSYTLVNDVAIGEDGAASVGDSTETSAVSGTDDSQIASWQLEPMHSGPNLIRRIVAHFNVDLPSGNDLNCFMVINGTTTSFGSRSGVSVAWVTFTAYGTWSWKDFAPRALDFTTGPLLQAQPAAGNGKDTHVLCCYLELFQN